MSHNNFMNKSLINVIYSALKYNHKTKYLIILCFINNIIIPFLSSDLLIQITNPEFTNTLIIYFLGLQFLESIIKKYVKNLINVISYNIEKDFIHQSIKQFDTLSYISKNKLGVNKFWEVLLSGSNSVESLIDWGLPCVTSLLGSIVSITWIFIKKDLITEFVIITSFIFTIYYFFLNKKQCLYNTTQKDLYQKNQNLRALLRLKLPAFQYKEYTSDDISNIYYQIKKNNHTVHRTWIDICYLSESVYQIIGIFIGYITMDDISKFMLCFNTVSKLSNSISNLTNFMTQYKRHCNEYNTFIDFWTDVEYSDEPEKLELVSNLQITSIDIKKNNFTLKLADNFGIFPFYQGIKILIRGKTGEGKSSLVEAITGKIPGCYMNYGKPENYYHLTSDMYQNIREKIPSSNITIRNYFKDEIDSSMIEKCIRYTFNNMEYNNLIIMLSDKSQEVHPFDSILNERLSGGQKQRILLATRCYEIDKKQKQILILDEPEQGSDTDTNIMLLQNIFNNYKHITIIMISHMCKCNLNQLNIKWDLSLYVENNIILNL